MPFLGKFCLENQNFQFKLKSGIYTNSNMQNSMVVFIFLVFDENTLFWVNYLDLPKVSKMSNLRKSALKSIHLKINYSAVPRNKQL